MREKLYERDGRGDWGKVYVATRYQPYLPAQTCESLIALAVAGMREGDSRDCVHSKIMHKAANILVRRFLASDCDTLCFIDSDAVFGAGALEELRSDVEGQRYDVLQAFTVKRGWPPEPMYLVAMPDQPRSLEAQRGRFMLSQLPLDADYIYQVDAVSLHFCLIRRWVFEKLLAPDGPDYTYWFEFEKDMGEDVTFCQRAQDVGARLGMSTRLKIGHVSDIVTGWDTMVDYYDRKLAVESGQEKPADLGRYVQFWEAQRDLSALVAEYTGEDIETVYGRSLQGGLPVADRWRVAAPMTPDQVRGFYGATPEYLYDLVKWNCSPSFQQILSGLRGVREERVLELGGGLGTLSEMLLVNGNDVTYCDVPGVLLDFARWRFERLGLGGRKRHEGSEDNHRVRFVESLSGAADPHDRVVAIDVLEHVHPDEIGRVLNALDCCLKPGGLLTVHNTWGPSAGYPQHFDHSIAWDGFIQLFTQIDSFTWRKI